MKSKNNENGLKPLKYRELGSLRSMIKILFVCHGSTTGSRELAALVGQNGAKCGIGDSGLLRFDYE